MTSETDGNEAPGGVERRAHERHSMSLRALVDLDGHDARPARILDFCIGGLFLMVDGQEGEFLVMAARQIGRGDRLRVTFNADGEQGPEAHVVQVKVARLFLGGMGVAFNCTTWASGPWSPSVLKVTRSRSPRPIWRAAMTRNSPS